MFLWIRKNYRLQDIQLSKNKPYPGGFAPADPLTRSLARRFDASLRPRGRAFRRAWEKLTLSPRTRLRNSLATPHRAGCRICLLAYAVEACLAEVGPAARPRFDLPASPSLASVWLEPTTLRRSEGWWRIPGSNR